MLGKSKLLLIVGLVIVVGSSLALYLYVSSLARPQATTTAVVVSQKVARYTALSETNIKTLFALKEVPEDLVPPSAVRNFAEISPGLVVQTVLYPGEFLLKDKLSTEKQPTTSLAADRRMREGMVAMAFTLSESGVVAGGVQPDDVVDILVTYSPSATVEVGPASAQAGGTGKVTWMLAQRVLVLNVGSNYVPNPEGPKPEAPANRLTTVTLLLTPEEATALKFLRDDGAVFDMVLHRAGDTTDLGQPLVTREDIVRDYIRPSEASTQSNGGTR